MIWAIKNNERVTANPKDNALCPICNKEVISKCGDIKIWHWAHKSLEDCDSWSEPESEWHINWKNEFPKEQQEVSVYLGEDDLEGNHYMDYKQKHRADIKTNNKLIIELQNTPISLEEIKIRENFYYNMIWLLNGKELASGLGLRKKKGIITFRWKHPSKSWWFARKSIYIDLGNFLFLIKKIYPHCPCGGWGIILSKEDFIKKFGDSNGKEQ